MIARFRAWLTARLAARLAWLDDDPTDGPTYAEDDTVAAWLSEDAEKRANWGHDLLAAVLDYEETHADDARCFEPELNRTVPFDILYNAAKGRVHVDTTGFTDRPMRDSLVVPSDPPIRPDCWPDDLPSTADPGVVTEQKEE